MNNIFKYTQSGWFYGFVLLIFLVAMSGIQYLGINSHYKIFFDDQFEPLINSELIEETFTDTDGITFVLVPKYGSIYDLNTFDLITDITERSWSIPFSAKVDSLSNHSFTVSQLDTVTIDTIKAHIDNGYLKGISDIRTMAENDPLVLGRLVSRNGDAAAIHIDLNLGSMEKDENTKSAVLYARSIKDEFQEYHKDIDIYVYGITPFNYSFSEVSTNDLAALVPLMLLIMTIFIYFKTWSLIYSICVLALSLLCVSCAFGVSGYLSIELNNVNITAANILVIIAVSNFMHITSKAQHLIVRRVDKNQIRQAATQANFYPITVSNLTVIPPKNSGAQK